MRELRKEHRKEVQRLAVLGYSKAECSRHLILKVADADKARAFLAELLSRNELTFSDAKVDCGINVGFTFRGLEAVRLPDRYLRELRTKAPAFSEGARARAARRLGDAGASAAERWEPSFDFDTAHVLISIHGASEDEIEGAVKRLTEAGAGKAFKNWQAEGLRAAHLPNSRTASDGSRIRFAHFGFRDGIAQPKIAVADDREATPVPFNAGELLLGYENQQNFNRWADSETSDDNKQFFVNGCFAIVRKMEQNEALFNGYLDTQVAALRTAYPNISTEFLKAKLCGRWPDGSLIKPGEWQNLKPEDPPLDDFKFKQVGDAQGLGCPFGSHIRRTNPRDDDVAPTRRRPLFRRGMPYGPLYSERKDAPRGLIGLFFCASIEDQFEHVMSEWVEKTPLGPPNRGTAKDPLVGHNDDPGSGFDIPLQGGGSIPLTGFAPFVTTRGTLYTFFPSRAALREISGGIRPPVESESAAKPADGTFDAPSDRYCDIVMEGGVTSGIIYASAVSTLASHYRFRSIGGSSIGAFAAALTAAAEYLRRKGSVAGFQQMDKLPGKLAEVEENGDKRPLLERLFRPQKETRRLFEIFRATLGDKWFVTRVFLGLAAALRQYWALVLGATALTAVLVLAGPLALTFFQLRSIDALDLESIAFVLGLGSWAVALLIALATATVAALLIGIGYDVWRGLIPNGFGLCRAWSPDETFSAPFEATDLAGFLHASIQAAAGRHPINDEPLTFQDLWDAPGSPNNVLGLSACGPASRSIVLEVYSTNLAHGRPYRFPLDEADDMGQLFFREKDMLDYFPKNLVDRLIARAPSCRWQNIPGSAPVGTKECFYELPREQLPVAVAARLALSFPLLISAVPLWAIDFEAPDGNRPLERCWLSDGGLCSNFPIHLFDSFVPKWPTFGISLQTRGRYQSAPVWLPAKHFEGRSDTWDRFDDEWAPGRFAGFLLSLWKATWRWNDMTMMRMPGVRDRVVRINLLKNEGGVNIRMSADEITNLARTYGKPAAEAFIDKFALKDTAWLEHRWVRFNRLLISLRQQIEGVAVAAGFDRYGEPLDARIADARVVPALRGPDLGKKSPSEEVLNTAQAEELLDLLAELRELESVYGEVGDNKPYIAVPRPSLRVRHPT